jgi:corrinoid protein of di/trimethylamine methyltransferase
MADLEELSLLMQKGRAKDVQAMVQALLDQGLSAKSILQDGLLAAMNVVGVKFKNNDIFVPEVLIAARAMNRGVEVLKPYLVDDDVEPIGTAVIGTVKGDLHDIGKNLVGMMFKGKGITVVDLGTDIPAKRFVEEAVAHDAKIIGCSALLTTTMKEMGNVVKQVKEQGLEGKIKVMVGGAPVSQAFCDSIGADAYTPDASTAADVALRFLRGE